MSINLKDPNLYLNRELSWLRFNSRVLGEAKNQNHPLLERLKFIAIYGTNLDEFYMVRTAGLQEMFKMGINATGPDGITPVAVLYEIREYIHNEKTEVEATLKDILSKLDAEGLCIRNYDQLDSAVQKKADKYFFNNLYPVIIPIAADATHPFPHLNNLSFAVAVKLRDKDIADESVFKYGLIRIPRVLPRFIEIEKNTFVPIESIVKHHIENLFTGYEPVHSMAFRVTRNADMVIEEEEAEDFLELMEEGIKSRRKGQFVRLTIEDIDDKDLLEFLSTHIKIDDGDVYRYTIPLDLGSLWQIVSVKSFVNLTYKPFMPRVLPPLNSSDSIFNAIEKQDICFYQPYESFDPVVRFISEAAKDPEVLSIKKTLYRVGKNSPIVRALIDASEEGKQVTALVELKARFDEENNMLWARALEQAGAHVVYGISGLKVHAKIALVIKKTKEGIKEYIHLSTGNYNTMSARIYTDIGFFTADKDIGKDATKFFHHLTGSAKYTRLSTLVMAPYSMKARILELIEHETKAGKDGQITAKMNALVDADVVLALYKASQAGVKIDLIIRGMCCLKPGFIGVSENIKIISIVGKYLEHARIFYFKNSTPQIYFSSADWMTRNLEKRIELLTPVNDQKIAQKLHEILKVQLNDNVQARELKENGEYEMVGNDGKNLIDSQKIMEEYISSVYENYANESKAKAARIASKLLKES